MLLSLREKEKETQKLCESSTEIANKRPCEETNSLREKSYQFSNLISDMIQKLVFTLTSLYLFVYNYHASF